MLTFNTKTKERGTGSEKGSIYGSHILFKDMDFMGLGTWKAVKATGSFTLSSQPSDGNTFTIGVITYRFKTALALANDILIGANLAATQANILAAINGDQSLIGVSYHASTRPNPSVSAVAFAANIMVVTALYGGTASNSVATTVSGTGSWGAATLTGGVNESAADSLLVPSNEQYNVSTYASVNQSLFSSGIAQDSSQISKRYNRLASDFDAQKLYAAAQAKKKVVPNFFNQVYKNVSKASFMSMLKENPGVTLGFNHNAIRKIVQVDVNKFVVHSTALTQFQVITIAADGSLTVGTLFTHSQAVNDFDVVDTGKVVGIRNIGATSYEHQYFTISGTTMSHSASTTFTVTGSGSATNLAVGKVATGKAVMIYRNNTTTYGLRVLDVTGAPSLGAEAVITPANVSNTPALVSHTTDAFAVFTGTVQVFIGNVTGTSIAMGSAYTVQNAYVLSGDNTPQQFDAIAINATNIVFVIGNGATQSSLVPILEQFSVSGTTASFVAVHRIRGQSTVNLNHIKILNVATDTYGIYIGNPSNIDSRYDTSNIMIPFTVSGSTVTLNQGFKKILDIFNTGYFSEPRKFMLKVGAFFVNFCGGATASVTAPVNVHTPCAVELYNHETLMGTVTTTYPFVENVINFDGVANAQISDYAFYLKVKNTSAQTHEISMPALLIEMDN